jgi:putative colanic acid biosynthesis acetyltransferase WcaF
MELARFNNDDFDKGRSRLVEVCWRVAEGLLFNSWLPGSVWRVHLLRIFGTTVGTGVIIKPHVRIKFPWKLIVGDDSWIGEGVWIDNLAEVSIGSNCCISQGAYLCTGSHRWDRATFDLEIKPIVIGDQCWIGAKSCISPGVTAGEGAVLALGSVATNDLAAWKIYVGKPAVLQKNRIMCDGANEV